MSKHLKTNYKQLGLYIALICSPLSFANAYEGLKENILCFDIEQNIIHVHGVVKDALGEGIIGASILEQGTTNGTITDIEGRFSLGVTEGAILQISYIGYLQKDVKASPNMEVLLIEDNQTLDEVVVVGYGTQKKVNLTGSVSSVSSKQMGDRSLTSVAAGLQGTMPGVTIKYESGRPGQADGNTSIRVRGTGTFNTASPMIIVDGMESTMYDLDPNDIESISVLKDAASAAIYGSKAANGVIVITTKRGRVGKSIVNYSGTFGWQSPTRRAKYVSSADYARLTNEARVNEGKDNLYTEDEIRLFENGSDPDNYANTDWSALLMDQSGFQQTHNLNISGGSEAIQYMVSLGYTDQNGIIRNMGMNKYNIRMNLDTKINDRLEGSFNMVYTRENLDSPTAPTGDYETYFYVINKLSPMIPYKKSNGDYGYIGDGNPIAWLDANSVAQTERNNMQTFGWLKYSILPELTLKGMASYKFYYGETHDIRKAVRYDDNLTHGSIDKLTESVYRDDRLSGDILIEYGKSFTQGHNLNILVGYHAELYRNYSLTGYREDLPNNELTDLNAAGTKNQASSGNTRRLSMLSYFGRINYNFKDKYLFESNMRYDGTSRFARGNRWGMFPSVSAGWRISEEEFFESLKDAIYSLKLRASWGKLGNQDIGSLYPTISTLSLGKNYPFAGVITPGAYTQFAVNKNLRWESTTTYGAGLDVNLFGKLDIIMDYYNKTTSGILMTVSTPMTFALSDYYDNVGKVENKGIELSATFNENIGKVGVAIGANIAFNKNKIIYMGVGGDQYNKDSNDAVFGIMRKGESMHSFYGYKTDGYFQSEAEIKAAYPNGWIQLGGRDPQVGDIKYVDVNGDGKLDANDRRILGSWDPGITFGFNLRANYKGWDVTAVFQGATDVYGYVTREGVGYINGDTSKPTTIWLDHWTPENPSATTPRLIQGMEGWSMPTTTSDFWRQNATYLRLKTLQIGYMLPKKWLNKIHLSNLRIFYTAENILTFTGFMDGYDPEAPVSNNTMKGNYYPQTKTNSFGINVSF